MQTVQALFTQPPGDRVEKTDQNIEGEKEEGREGEMERDRD